MGREQTAVENIAQAGWGECDWTSGVGYLAIKLEFHFAVEIMGGASTF